MLMVSAFVLVLVALPAFAQRGGGHGGGGGGHFGGGGGGHSFGGGMASHGGGFSSHVYSGHGSSGSYAGSGYTGRPSPRAYSARPGFSSRPYSYSASRGYNRYNHGGTGIRIRTYGYGRYGYGRGLWGYGGYGYPWWYYPGYYDPYWLWDSDSDSSDDSGAQYYGPQYGYGYDNGLANQLDDPGPPPPYYDQGPDNYARSAPVTQQPGSSIVPPTLLIFRDQHKEEVQNYAIVGQTLWNFAPQRTEKIPLSSLDIPATTKANEDRGVDFRLPVTQGKLSLEIQSDSIN